MLIRGARSKTIDKLINNKIYTPEVLRILKNIGIKKGQIR